MVCHEFKGGTGTSSRRITAGGRPYTLGVLVQCNYGGRAPLRVAGVPVGQEIRDLLPCNAPAGRRHLRSRPAAPAAPCRRRARTPATIRARSSWSSPPTRRSCPTSSSASPGAPRSASGGWAASAATPPATSSSPSPPPTPAPPPTAGWRALTALPNDAINPLFEATIDATSEAILNAMLAAETMTGADGYRVHALPHDRLMAAMRKYGRVK